MLAHVHPQDLAIVKALVSVAWADGHVTAEESEIISSLLEAYGATPTERREITLFARQPRTLADVPIHELSHDDRRVLLQHAVLLSFIDGAQDVQEKRIIDELCEVLRIPSVEARGIVRAAEERAKSMLGVLNAMG
jgi:prepilin-type processing-associated H-X9-DG protein